MPGLQFLIRIFLWIRIEENYENNERTSKHYWGFRKGCSIELSLLEKRLTLDLAKRTGDQFACTTSDLEACCDRKIPNIGGACLKNL